jgi:ribulose-phosphate 3-epimerase
MIERPERQLAEFAKAGADSCTVHVETCPHLHHTLGQIHELGMTAGATLNPATPTAALREAAREADVLLCMSVDPGWGGQKFIESSIERPGMGLEIDGGVSPATIERCHGAGANLMVAGSAIYDQPSPGEAWRKLAALVSDA